ncbi:hypothetical protein JW979_05300 [bacterium]|nr:hypothetical protein [candidate division CSSED10-310 bacterium]
MIGEHQHRIIQNQNRSASPEDKTHSIWIWKIVWILILVFLGIRLGFLAYRLVFPAIMSDRTFLTTTEFYKNWYSISFDDASWHPAEAPYWDGYEIPLTKQIPIPAFAFPIWSESRANTVYFRKTFTLKTIPDCPVNLSIFVDDGYELYINEHQIPQKKDKNGDLETDEYQVSKYLKSGKNVIAVMGMNNALAAQLILYMHLPKGILVTQRDFFSLFAVLVSFSVVFLIPKLIQYIRRAERPELFKEMPNRALTFGFGSMLLCWMAWLMYYRLNPVYEMIPTVVMSRIYWFRMIFMVIIGVLVMGGTLFFLKRIIISQRQLFESGNTFLNRRNYVIFFGLVCSVALFLRVYRYNEVPPGIFQDDASFMVEGESLVENGQFKVWVDEMNGNATLMMYWDGIISKLVPNKILAMRIAPALLGTITIGLMFVLLRNNLTREQICLVAVITAFSHYHINYSRLPWDQVTVPLFSMIAIFMLLDGMYSRRGYLFCAISGVATSLGFYGYAGFRAVPVVILGLILAGRSTIRRFFYGVRWLIYSMAALIISAPLGIFFISHPEKFMQRTHLVDIFPTFTKYLDPCPVILQTLKTLMMIIFVGDGVTVRHNTPGAPALDLISSVFFIVGLALFALPEKYFGAVMPFISRQKASVVRMLMIWWIISGAFISSLTFEGPHFSRSIIIQIPIFITAGLGLWVILIMLRPSWRWIVSLAAIAGIGYLNIDTYFIQKLKHPDVYEDCGYISLHFNNRLKELQSEDQNITIAVTKEMWYINHIATRWLNKNIANQKDLVINNIAQLMRIQKQHPQKSIYVFIHPRDYIFEDILRAFETTQKVYFDPGKQPLYTEYKVKPQMRSVTLDLIPGQTKMDGVSPGLIRYLYANPSWEGEYEKLDIVDNISDFSYESEGEKPIKPPFSMRWAGLLKVPQTGVYRFDLTSDDGSYLIIQERVVIDNGGEHGILTESGLVNLGIGYHPIEIRYFDNQWKAEFKIRWQVPSSNEIEPIPAESLFHVPENQ